MSLCVYCYQLQGLLVLYGTTFIPSIISVCFDGYALHHTLDDDSDHAASDTGSNTSSSKWLLLIPRNKSLCHALAAFFQLLVLIVFVTLGASRGKSNVGWSVPLSLVLVSCRSWYNYIGEEAAFDRLKVVHGKLMKFRNQMHAAKVVIQLTAGIWKIVVTFALLPLFVGHHLQMDSVRKAGASNRWSAIFQLNMG